MNRQHVWSESARIQHKREIKIARVDTETEIGRKREREKKRKREREEERKREREKERMRNVPLKLTNRHVQLNTFRHTQRGNRNNRQKSSPIPFLTFVLSVCFLPLVRCLFDCPDPSPITSPFRGLPFKNISSPCPLPRPKLLFTLLFSPLFVYLNLFSWTCPCVSWE